MYSKQKHTVLPVHRQTCTDVLAIFLMCNSHDCILIFNHIMQVMLIKPVDSPRNVVGTFRIHMLYLFKQSINKIPCTIYSDILKIVWNVV